MLTGLQGTWAGAVPVFTAAGVISPARMSCSRKSARNVDHSLHRWGVILAGGDGKRLLPLTRRITGLRCDTAVILQVLSRMPS